MGPALQRGGPTGFYTDILTGNECTGAHIVCGSCVSANETGTDCLDSCEFEYTWQQTGDGGEAQCLHIETKLEPEGCNGVPGMCIKCFLVYATQFKLDQRLTYLFLA